MRSFNLSALAVRERAITLTNFRLIAVMPLRITNKVLAAV